MKKVIFLLCFAVTAITFAQEAADKKIQAGLNFGFGLNLNKTATKKMATNGVGNNLAIGLALNYKLSNTIAFNTGVDIDFENNYTRSTGDAKNTYYQFSDTKILRNEDASPTDKIFLVETRTQKPIYLTIPTMLLFRTKFIGYFRYFGKFGLRTSFLLGNKINDVGYTFENNNLNDTKIASDNNTMKAARDMNFLRASAGFSFGTEWNFSGSTSLAAELGYYYGFIPIFADNKDKNRTLYYFDNQNNDTYYSNQMTQSLLQLKISLLF
jgi:hypothetical protein